MSVGRLLLRLIVVPIGAVLAACAGTMVSFAANWGRLVAMFGSPTDGYFTLEMALGALMALVFSYATFTMLMPACIGVLIAEAFSIRSWIFHALNGGLSIWVGWTAIGEFRGRDEFYDSPLSVLAAGLAAGFVYWAIAGWNAGVTRPPRAAPPGAVKPR